MSILESQLYRRISLSLNDLDNIIRRRRKNVSSSEVSFDSRWTPADPLYPALPPPARVKTPPGLPSFGTREAQLLRLAEQPSSPMSMRLRNWLHSRDESAEHPYASLSGGTPPFSPSYSPPRTPRTPPAGSSDTRDLFRRTLAAMGMARMLDSDPNDPAFPPRRVQSPPQTLSARSSMTSIPPWIYKASIPGPLARADDGTFMRGAFGPRGSGHGVGARTVEMLPMARLSKRTRTPTMSSAAPAELPSTLAELRGIDAASGARGVSAIGPAEYGMYPTRRRREGKPRGKCGLCCESFWRCLCAIPKSEADDDVQLG
jgi:hypothetical protein